MMKFRLLIFAIVATLAFTVVVSCNLRGRLAGIMPQSVSSESLTKIKLPPGFKISIYAEEVENARSMALSPSGILYVGNRQKDKVYAVIDSDKNNHGEKVITLAEKLKMPNGVAFREGALFVAEVNRILKFPNIESSLENPPAPQIISTNYPSDEHHGWKFIRFGPDGKLYVPVGAPCNVCLQTNPVYASITRLNPDGSGFEIVAHGVRNTVGFDWHPETKELWFTENGRDEMGDDVPPDELNRMTTTGTHYGFPFEHGKRIPDPEFKPHGSNTNFQSPELELGPHVAALGMRFYTGNMFPEKYRDGIFIAEHGSWNRSKPIGYRIMFVQMEKNRAVSYEVFAEGWLDDAFAWGRPVDVLVMPDGALLVSDDKAGLIYRITYTAP